MNYILRIYVPSTLHVVTQHTKVLTVKLNLTPDISKYISWSGSLSSQDWESMKLEVMRLIIHVTVVNWIINLTVVQFNMSYTLKTHQLEVSTSMIKTNHLSWCVMVFVDETPNFITDLRTTFWVYKELVIYIFCD